MIAHPETIESLPQDLNAATKALLRALALPSAEKVYKPPAHVEATLTQTRTGALTHSSSGSKDRLLLQV